MAYDSARGVVVLFGGVNHQALGDTWEWNGTTWILRATDGPSPRYACAISYDAARGVIVLFGGYGSSQDDILWEWDGQEWTRRDSSGPVHRGHRSMAYDTRRNVVVLYGAGENDYEPPEETTWEWNGMNWTGVERPGPRAREAHAMAFDTLRNETILFGGIEGAGASLGDTWGWDGHTWALRATTGPSPRNFHAMAYDSDRAVAVLFGGAADPNGNQLFSDTWEWNGQEWTLVSTEGPSPRWGHQMAYDSMRKLIVLQGGDPSGQQTWEWNGSVWTRRLVDQPTGYSFSFGLAYDIAQKKMIGAFGDAYYMLGGGTWGWDGNQWTRITPYGEWAVEAFPMVYDSWRQIGLVQGGWVPNDFESSDTWKMNGSTWTKVADGRPNSRVFHAMVYDSIRGAAVLFGGYQDDFDAETWEYSFAECDSIGDLKAVCRQQTLKAKVLTTLPAGTVLTLDNDGDRRTMRIGQEGKGKARWREQKGAHGLTIVECPTFHRTADCGP
ncbi:MAG: hypothetical protein U0163_21165 [Gemmatimonadaceae bacterium]